MLVTLMCEDKLYNLPLPEKIQGYYWIEDVDLEITDNKRKLIGIEGENNVWKIIANRKRKLYDPDTYKEVSELQLEVGKIYPVEIQRLGKSYIFTEAYTKDRCTYKKYFVQPNTVINIGQGRSNQIIIAGPYVSSLHAQISLIDNKWIG